MSPLTTVKGPDDVVARPRRYAAIPVSVPEDQLERKVFLPTYFTSKLMIVDEEGLIFAPALAEPRYTVAISPTFPPLVAASGPSKTSCSEYCAQSWSPVKAGRVSVKVR